jgi:hypothetical protein
MTRRNNVLLAGVTLAIGVFVLEAYVLDGWFIGLFVAVTLGLVGAYRKRDLGIVGLALAMFGSIVVARHLNNVAAENRGARIAEACGAFRRDHGNYPESLADLVPAYLPSIPDGKLTRRGRKWH